MTIYLVSVMLAVCFFSVLVLFSQDWYPLRLFTKDLASLSTNFDFSSFHIILDLKTDRWGCMLGL